MNIRNLELCNRHKLNPILTTQNYINPITNVFNACATLLQNGNTLLKYRVEERSWGFPINVPPDDKDAALLPRRINWQWALMLGPVCADRAHLWISYSFDFRNWGKHILVMDACKGDWWASNKIGLSPPTN